MFESSIMNKIILLAFLFTGAPVFAANHVGFVNVGHALDERLFCLAVTNGPQLSLSIMTKLYRQDKLDISAAIAEAAKGPYAGDRKIVVYYVNTPDFPPQITVPGRFAVVNVRGLNKDADEKLYWQRILKMTLKGVALACGFGANQDVGRCVMSAGSFDSLKGIDSTSASYSPFCYFPLMEYLRRLDVVDVSDDE